MTKIWTYRSEEVTSHDDLLPGCTDFVYLITYVDGRMYIGKKTVRSIRKKPPLKGKKRPRRILTNLPFVDYEGSMEIENPPDIAAKEILYQCRTKKAATYLETALLFHHDAIFDDTYLNQNIGGRFFDNDLQGLIEYPA